MWMAMGGLWKLKYRCANSKFFASSIDFFDFQGLPFTAFFAARFGALGAPSTKASADLTTRSTACEVGSVR
jgi:hypothetical protein